MKALDEHLHPAPGEIHIDARHYVLYPGFVNTHHPLAQSVLKGAPEGFHQGLADWLGSVPYRFWPHITPELMYCAAILGFAEQLRSDVTTCADHHYLYHATTTYEREGALWQAATDLGIRFVLCLYDSTTQRSHKGLARSNIKVESLEQIIRGLEYTYDRYHQAGSDAMRQPGVAPVIGMAQASMNITLVGDGSASSESGRPCYL